MVRTYQQSDTVLSSPIEDDFVALSVEQGTCFAMPGVTASIWRLLEKPCSLDGLVDALMDEYDVDEQTCRADVAEILERMGSEGLLRDAPATQADVG